MNSIQQEVWPYNVMTITEQPCKNQYPLKGGHVFGPYRAGQATGYAGSPYFFKTASPTVLEMERRLPFLLACRVLRDIYESGK